MILGTRTARFCLSCLPLLLSQLCGGRRRSRSGILVLSIILSESTTPTPSAKYRVTGFGAWVLTMSSSSTGDVGTSKSGSKKKKKMKSKTVKTQKVEAAQGGLYLSDNPAVGAFGAPADQIVEDPRMTLLERDDAEGFTNLCQGARESQNEESRQGGMCFHGTVAEERSSWCSWLYNRLPVWMTKPSLQKARWFG